MNSLNRTKFDTCSWLWNNLTGGVVQSTTGLPPVWNRSTLGQFITESYGLTYRRWLSAKRKTWSSTSSKKTESEKRESCKNFNNYVNNSICQRHVWTRSESDGTNPLGPDLVQSEGSVPRSRCEPFLNNLRSLFHEPRTPQTRGTHLCGWGGLWCDSFESEGTEGPERSLVRTRGGLEWQGSSASDKRLTLGESNERSRSPDYLGDKRSKTLCGTSRLAFTT